MSTYHCTFCGRAIFRSADILRRVGLSQLGDHRVECFEIRRAIDPDSLRRHDVSLHEGWYCCRFIMMRMLFDKFRTGSALLVYTDSVVEVGARDTPPPILHPAAVKLGKRDHDAVIAATPGLVVVKHGARWCPPCRHMDALIPRVRHAVPGVRFFDVDVDEDPEIASDYAIGSIPYFVFFGNGRRLAADAPGVRTIDGIVVGAVSEPVLIALCQRMQAVVVAEIRPGIVAGAPRSP